MHAKANSKPRPSVDARRRRSIIYFTLAPVAAGGVFSFLPGAVASSTDKSEFWPLMLTSLAFAALCAGFVVVALRNWFEYQRRTRMGTAYIIEEIAQNWTPEDKQGFLDGLERHFGEVREVSGPFHDRARWEWPLGAGVERWSDKLDALVDATLSARPKHPGAESAYLWALWPVAMGWGLRMTAQLRGWALTIRQRRSDGREPLVETSGLDDGHDFRWNSLAPVKGHRMPARTIRIEIEESGDHATHRTSDPVTLLLVRMTRGAWGDLSLDQDTVWSPAKLPVIHIANSSGLSLSGVIEAELREWRCLADGALHDWRDYPALAQSAVTWISAQASTPGVVLLGTLIPQEVGVGMGLLAGRGTDLPWPRHLWPVVRDAATQGLAIAGLDLGLDRRKPPS